MPGNKVVCMLAMLVSISIGYIFGWYFSEEKYLHAIGNQALIDVSRNVALLEIMGENTPNLIRVQIDMNIARHLSNVIKYHEDASEKERRFRKNTISKLGAIWRSHAPFQDADISEIKNGDTNIRQYFDSITSYVKSNGEEPKVPE